MSRPHRTITRFEAACRRDEIIGSLRPEEQPKVEAELASAREALHAYIASIRRPAWLPDPATAHPPRKVGRPRKEVAP
jgi:hypothetical protein